MGDLLDYPHGVLLKLPVPRVEGVRGEISTAWIGCGGHVMGLLGSSQGNLPCLSACTLNFRLAEATQTTQMLVLAICVDAVQNNSFFFVWTVCHMNFLRTVKACCCYGMLAIVADQCFTGERS